MNARYPDMAPALLALMAERGATRVDIDILQPADPFLDTAGEELRSRIFMTQNERGDSLCLRPEFTIPVCRLHIASGESGHRRYCYLGEVFRQRREGGNEFFQAGIEDIGDIDHAAADARSLADALAILERALPGRAFRVVCGDQSIFEALLAGLGLPEGWQRRLARAFGSRSRLDQALARLADPAEPPALEPDLALLVNAGDGDALAERIGAHMLDAGLPLKASRTPQEIAARLIDKFRLSRTRLEPAALQTLNDFLALRVPLAGAEEALERFASERRIDLEAALADFKRRAAALRAAGCALSECLFDAGFGRPLEYYSGLVFEIHGTGPGAGPAPLAGGGRYDRLLAMLGAPGPVPGVGFSIWLDRIERERRP